MYEFETTNILNHLFWFYKMWFRTVFCSSSDLVPAPGYVSEHLTCPTLLEPLGSPKKTVSQLKVSAVK